MEIDPKFITTGDWSDLGALATSLWIIVGFAMTISIDFLIAHALIPSLVETGHLPRQLGRARPLFYAISATAVIGLVVFVISRLELLQVILDIYNKTWI